MIIGQHRSLAPSKEMAQKAKVALELLENADGVIQMKQLDGSKTQKIELPTEAAELFLETLRHLSNGKAVLMMPHEQALTTQQAANILNISRPHLVKLLESGEIPFEKVGTHRRVKIDDLLEWKEAATKIQLEAIRSSVRRRYGY